MKKIRAHGFRIMIVNLLMILSIIWICELGYQCGYVGFTWINLIGILFGMIIIISLFSISYLPYIQLTNKGIFLCRWFHIHPYRYIFSSNFISYDEIVQCDYSFRFHLKPCEYGKSAKKLEIAFILKDDTVVPWNCKWFSKKQIEKIMDQLNNKLENN